MNQKNTLKQNPFAGRFETSEEKKKYILNLFSSIPDHYDNMNRVMSLGMDMNWRRKSIRLAKFKKDGLLLDLATGTGDMIIAAEKFLPEAKIVGLDFCEPLIQLAQEKVNGKFNHQKVNWIKGDALELPFEDNCFDGAFTAFALRNVISVKQVFAELYRVIRLGGKVVSLEMMRQKNQRLKKIFSFYFNQVTPRLGRWLTSYPDAYSYLPLSIENFCAADELSDLISSVGWKDVRYKSLMFQNVAIHVGEK
ncbi:MAG: bifunctional demethylmenaquinone methyltransferase/2-methoxy-6-polyprenyl-1,4-benzoquinol methylase UbiE [bacterium]|nr:MAG: bifunctional demethylmenaquinone methyltransferase/2-methoxy-6-polyprenyl-1,4-benzoquinol methylase UbiE [bacterium]